jgi:hypothetical protein
MMVVGTATGRMMLGMNGKCWKGMLEGMGKTIDTRCYRKERHPELRKIVA